MVPRVALKRRTSFIVAFCVCVYAHTASQGSISAVAKRGFIDASGIPARFLDFFSGIRSLPEELDQIPIRKVGGHKTGRSQQLKDWTIIIYMAADNELQKFAIRNIRQMATVGSTDYADIFVHLDIRVGNKKTCSHFYIQRGGIDEFVGECQNMDSGDPQSLISCVQLAVQNFPAKNYMIVCWDHGTGAIDPAHARNVHPMDLLMFNPATQELELDRSCDFLELSDADREMRGVCWDDSTGHYLTNQKLISALKEIKESPAIMNNKKFAIIGFDTCLMSMSEIAFMVKDYADLLVASEEVEFGTGWDYSSILEPLKHAPLDPVSLACHIVDTYGKTYAPYTQDYTLAAVNLDVTKMKQLEANIGTVASLLSTCLKGQKNNTVKKAIALSRNRKFCTHFETPQYIDLHHFYRNLLANLKSFSLTSRTNEEYFVKKLQDELEYGKSLIEDVVIANIVGRNLSQARGLSIYFPEQSIHHSYSTFSSVLNTWSSFLAQAVPLA